MSALDVTVPDIGDFTDIPVISILVGVGDSVSAEDPLIELESDKATMEVPGKTNKRFRFSNIEISQHSV